VTDVPVVDPDLELELATPFPHSIRALSVRDFRLFWTGGVISSIGNNMQLAALGWVVAVATESALRVTLITFATVVPLLVLGPAGGWLADRFPKRRLLMATQTAMMIQAFALWAVWQADAASYWVLVALSLAGGILTAFNITSWQSIVPELVPRTLLQNAVMLNSTQFNVARAAGPMLAGLLLAGAGAGWCFLVNALSFGVVLAALLAMRSGSRAMRTSGQRGVMQGFMDALRYVRRSPGLMTAITAHSAHALAGAPIAILVPVLAVEVLDVGAGAFGLLLGSFGVGAVLVAVVLGNIDQRIAPSRILAWGIAWSAISAVLLAVSQNLVTGIVVMAVYGAAYVVLTSMVSTTIQRQSTDEIRGRVTSLWLMIFGTFFPIGVIGQGALADVIGLRWVLAIDGAVFVAVLVLLTACRALPSIDRGV
jgi:MFS family permease